MRRRTVAPIPAGSNQSSHASVETFPRYGGCAVRRQDRVSKAPENGRFREEDYHDKDLIYVVPADELAGARELWVPYSYDSQQVTVHAGISSALPSSVALRVRSIKGAIRRPPPTRPPERTRCLSYAGGLFRDLAGFRSAKSPDHVGTLMLGFPRSQGMGWNLRSGSAV